MRKLSTKEAINLRDQLREARLKAQKDAEAFEEVVFVVERIGCYLGEKQGDLGRYKAFIVELAAFSPLFCAAADPGRDVHTPFPQLYDLVKKARNGCMHEGVTARHATSHAVELAIVLEDALMRSCDNLDGFRVSDFMVKNVVCAEMWQPLSFIRQTMLVNSFSFLPLDKATAPKRWYLVSDKAVAVYLRLKANGATAKALVQSLEDAVRNGLKLIEAHTCRAGDSVNTILQHWDGPGGQEGYPVLAVRGEPEELFGILAPEDLL